MPSVSAAANSRGSQMTNNLASLHQVVSSANMAEKDLATRMMMLTVDEKVSERQQAVYLAGWEDTLGGLVDVTI